MAKRPAIPIVAALVVAAAGVVVCQIRRDHLATYKGKTAAAWFKEFCAAEARHQRPDIYTASGRIGIGRAAAMSTDIDGWFADPAADGLRALGTNAAFYLANEFLRDEKIWAARYRKTFYKLPKTIQRIVPKPPDPPVFVRMKIAHALQALGTNALPAACILIESYANSDPSTRLQISEAVRSLRYEPETLHPVLQRLAAEQQFSLALDLIGNSRLRSPEACTVLGSAVLDGDLPIKTRAVGLLTYIGPNAAVAVPALTNVDKELRYSATSALAEIGPPARAAVPTLEGCTNDASALVQHAARRALQAISAQTNREAE